MFINAERANKITGAQFDLTVDDLYTAQAMLESYTGREESVITDADDIECYAKATAYQAAYLKNNTNNVFEQARVDSITQDSSSIQYTGDLASPFIAPLAAMALRNLTWKKSRSIHTGKNVQRTHRLWDWKRA